MRARVTLPKNDRRLSAEAIRDKYRLCMKTAVSAKARGWFYGENDLSRHLRLYLAPEDRLLTRADLARKFGVSLPVAGEAKKRGWVCPGYGSTRLQRPSCLERMERIGLEELQNCAKIGALYALRKWCARDQSRIGPFELSDLTQSNLLTFLELAADARMEKRGFRINAAILTATNFLKRNVWKHSEWGHVPTTRRRAYVRHTEAR